MRIASPAFLRLIPLLLVLVGGVGRAQQADPVAPYRAARDAFLRDSRVNGTRDPAALASALRGLQTLAAGSGGDVRARALVEIGNIERFSNQFAEAAAAYTEAADIAARIGRTDIAFDAWIGVARAHLLGTHDYGAAEDAVERAIDAAGSHPSPKQRFDIADYIGQTLEARGELESALAGALDAARLVQAPEDRFYAELLVGSTLVRFAERCDFRQLTDSRSAGDSGGDGWDGCRRAVAAAVAAYQRAIRTATGLGWTALANMVRSMSATVAARRTMIDTRALGPRLFQQLNPSMSPEPFEFAPRDLKDVLVGKGDFLRQLLTVQAAGSSTSADTLAPLVEEQIASAERAGQKDHPRTLFLRALLADMRGGQSQDTAALLGRAAELLTAQRASFFDPRRRGTVIEGHGDMLMDLALRLVALGRDGDAFAAFESTRARGLGELTHVLARDDVTAADREWLAELLAREAETSAIAVQIAGTVIGEGLLDPPAPELSRWAQSDKERRAFLRSRPDVRARLARSGFSPVGLADLQRAAADAGTAVLLYSVDATNVYVWYAGPHGYDFRRIFLPEPMLAAKAAKLLAAVRAPGTDFNEPAARQLYLYLIAPLEDLLDAERIVVVPEGPIVGLPFEALVRPDTGAFVSDRWVLSYAPNAALALDMLKRPVPAVRQVGAVIDVEIDDYTHELDGIVSVPGLRLRTFDSNDVMPGKLGDVVRGADSLHVLLHGEFDHTEPLLSTLGETARAAPRLRATALLALPLRGLKLAVLSACESGVLGVRISNEIYGFPWVLLAGGVENVVTSRWRVNGSSNGRWMHAFYGALASGASPALAAATASRKLRRDGEPHPYFWAAMQVSGR